MLKTIEFQDRKKLYITDDPVLLRELLSQSKHAIPAYNDDNISLEWPHTDYAVSDIDELLEVNCDRDNIVEGIDFIPDYLKKIHERLEGLPWHILDTEHLSIREMTVSDVDTFYMIYDDEEVTKYVEPLFSNPLDEKIYTQNYIRDIYGYYGYGLWTVLDRKTGNIIGRAGISNRDGFDIPELGFVIAKDYRGHGLGYEVCRGILEYARNELDFDRIQALVLPNNEISINLLTKLNFSNTGLYHEEYQIFECYLKKESSFAKSSSSV